jgi:hypothetical protein
VGASSLSIWTRHLRGLEFHEKWNGTTNRPDVSGKWKSAAVTYGSGNVWMYVNEQMAMRKHMVVAGAEAVSESVLRSQLSRLTVLSRQLELEVDGY